MPDLSLQEIYGTHHPTHQELEAMTPDQRAARRRLLQVRIALLRLDQPTGLLASSTDMHVFRAQTLDELRALERLAQTEQPGEGGA
jgi:hypothetical protein